MSKTQGKLYLIPNTLGDSPINNVIPSEIKTIINSVDHYIVENIRTARRFLKKVDPSIIIDNLSFYELNKHTKPGQISNYLNPATQGKNVGIISEAGVPGVADPGAEIVSIAHEKNIIVVPLVGPSSILLAVMASGMNGQNFAFIGYLPIKPHERVSKIRALEKRSKFENQTQIFIETPYRNNALIKDVLKSCNENTYFCIAYDITLETECIQTKTIKEWKRSIPDIHKKPCIFLIHGV